MAARRKPVTLSAAVQVSELEGLRALRSVLAAEIESPRGEVPQTAALARQLRDVLAQISALEKLVVKGSVVDDLAGRRTKRRAAVAKGSAKSGGDGVDERTGGG